MTTADTVNDKDLKAAVSLGQDIYLYGPLSFKAIAVGNLYTNDLISNIDYNQWTANALRSWAPQRQVVTGHWTVKNAAVDSIYSNSGVNGIDAAAYLRRIESSNRHLYRNYKETCNQVQSLIDESHKNVIFLSHFEIAFKLAHAARVDSIYLFEIGRQNYLLTNAGCWTSLHYWNHQTQRFERLSNAYTGVVNGWIHLVDLRNALHFVSIGDQANAKTGCSISGANVWKYESESQKIVAVAAFGSAGDFRSMQVKPDSRTHFYALRVRDNRVIEFNLNGAPVTEWIVDQVKARASAWNFVPASANLGLAISNGKTLSLLGNEETTLLAPMKWKKQQDETQQTIAKLRKAFADYNLAKKAIFNEGALSAKYDPKKLEEIRERVRKIDESVVPHANELIETLENGLHATAIAASMNQSDPEVGRSFGGSLRDIIIHELDTVTNFVTGEESDESSEEEGLFPKFHLGLLGNPQQTNDGNGPSNRKNQNSSFDGAIVGDNFGDLMENVTPMADVLFDKLMERIRQRKIKQHKRPKNAYTYSDVGSAKNSSMRPDDAVLGDQFGDMLENLTPVADDVFDKLMDYIRKRKRIELEADGINDLESVRNASGLSDDDAFVGDLFSYLQGKIELELIRYRDSNDPNVGDQFGIVMDNLTPVADSLFDQLMDKIEMEKRRRPFLDDEFTRATHTNVNATMLDIVQWIQNQRPMHYDPFNQNESVTAFKTDRTVYEIGQAIQEAVKGLGGTDQHRKSENIHQMQQRIPENQRTNPLVPSEVAISEDGARWKPMHNKHPHIHSIHVKPSHIKHLPGHFQKPVHLVPVHSQRPPIHSVQQRADLAQENLTHVDGNRNSDSDPMVGDSEHFHKYTDTLHKYIEIAKGIYNRGKLVFEEIKGMKDDNSDASADYAAPESHRSPHSHHNQTESHHSSNTSDAIVFDQPEYDRPSHHESNISHHESNDLPDNNSHSDQTNSDNRPEKIQPAHNDFDTPEPHRPYHHESNNSPQSHHQSIENIDSNDHSKQQDSDHRPHENDFDSPPEPHQPHHNESSILPQTHQNFDKNDHSNQQGSDTLPEPHRPHRRPHHRLHHHYSNRPHESYDNKSNINGHVPNLSDFVIPPEDIRSKNLHNHAKNKNQAVMEATKHRDPYGLLGAADNEQDLQSAHDEDDPFLELSHTVDTDGNGSGLSLDADPIVGDGQSNRWVSAFRKCKSFVKQIYHSGKSIMAKIKNETRRSDSMVGSVHEITPNHLNPQVSGTTLLSINRLGDLSSHAESELLSTASDASEFHDDTEDLLSHLEAIYDKYRHTDTGDSSEDKFRSDVHNVFVKMEQVIAKYEKNAVLTIAEQHESRGRLKRRDKSHVKRIETMSVSMPDPYLSSQSNNEIVAVTVGPEQKPLIIASSRRENVIKGAHDSIQVNNSEFEPSHREIILFHTI